MTVMFTEEDFECFEIEGLEARMAAIRSRIQPKFQTLDTLFVESLSETLGEVLPIHIAQHRRRTTYAPESTWSAMGGDQRGYKKYPHFQLAINGEYCAMWLSFIDQPQKEKEMMQALLDQLAAFNALEASHFVVSKDHTQSAVMQATMENIEQTLIRARDVKKGEIQIGRIIERTSPLLKDQKKAQSYMLETYQKLVPFYQLARAVQVTD